tara:strand:- start:124 stop:444 length:321 start_codon:yes stop_codon:yes gene_type:complete
MKEFLEKHKKKIEDYGTLIPPAYWFLVWIDFTKINLLFIFVLPLSTFFWIWVIIEEFKKRKKNPKEKKLFFLVMPFVFLLLSTISTIHIYYIYCQVPLELIKQLPV